MIPLIYPLLGLKSFKFEGDCNDIHLAHGPRESRDFVGCCDFEL